MIRSTLRHLFTLGVQQVTSRLDRSSAAGKPASTGPYGRAMPLSETPDPALFPDTAAAGSTLRPGPLPAGWTPPTNPPQASSSPPPMRPVFYPRVRVSAPPLDAPSPDGVRILAQVSADNRQCTFTVDRPILAGLSWRFQDAASALGSPLVTTLFSNPQVAWVQVDHDTVLVARRAGKDGDWRPLAAELGRSLRAAVVAGLPVLSDETRAALPAPEMIQSTLNEVIAVEVNPNLAAHGGYVTLHEVRGNAVYVEMGGGCQGCSAAALTLKVGIYNAFRAAIPGVGAIYDLTDHTAGTNPFFEGPTPEVP